MSELAPSPALGAARFRGALTGGLYLPRPLRLVTKRLALAVPQMLAISFITFAFMRLLPGNPAVQLAGPAATPETIRRYEHLLGIDQPFFVQYWHYLGRALHGNLGVSIATGGSVASDLLTRTPATLELITISLILIALLYIPIGIYSARPARTRAGRFLNRGIFGYGLLAGALPDFWLGLILIYVFFYRLKLMPAPLGRLDPGTTPPHRITGFLLIDSTVEGNWSALGSAVKHLILPEITLVFVYGGAVLKMARSTVSGVLDAPYVRFASACGLPVRKLLKQSALSSIGPVVTILAVVYGYLLGGAVLVENVFSWGGVGQYAAQAVVAADFEAIQGFVLVAVVFNLVVYLVADLIHAAVDPRVQV